MPVGGAAIQNDTEATLSDLFSWDAGQVLHNPPDVIAIVNVAFWRRGKGDDWESFLVPATGKVGQLEGEEVQNLRSSGGVVRRCFLCSCPSHIVPARRYDVPARFEAGGSRREIVDGCREVARRLLPAHVVVRHLFPRLAPERREKPAPFVATLTQPSIVREEVVDVILIEALARAVLR